MKKIKVFYQIDKWWESMDFQSKEQENIFCFEWYFWQEKNKSYNKLEKDNKFTKRQIRILQSNKKWWQD